IKQMVDYMRKNYSIDANRVFVTGLSGGANMSAALLAVYPDVFAAGSINAGVPYGCTNFALGTTCLSPGVTQSATTWGNLVRGAYPGYAGPYPKVSIWHGDADATIAFSNMAEL